MRVFIKKKSNMERQKPYYEYSEDKDRCRHNLAVSVNSCRRCLFEALCHLEYQKDLQNKESE